MTSTMDRARPLQALPEIEDVTRREFLKGVGGLLVFGAAAGCGGGTGGDGGGLPPLPEIDDATRREFLIGAASLLVLSPLGCGSGGAGQDESSGGTRTVQHEMGDARVPRDPRRVIALDAFYTLQVAVEAGVPVVGSAILSPEEPFPATLTEAETEGIESVGIIGQPDLEKVAALGPDLIMGTSFIDPPYDRLKEIAPTVVLGNPFDWKPYVRSVGEVTGRSGVVERGLAEYEARARDLRGRLGDASVSHAHLLGNETFDNYVQGPGAAGPFRVLEELGVVRPPAEVSDNPGTFAKTLSLEELPSLSGDVLFYNVGDPALDEASLREAAGVTDGPLWQEIPAVQSGNAYGLDPNHWMIFGGLRSANLVLDDVEKHLT